MEADGQDPSEPPIPEVDHSDRVESVGNTKSFSETINSFVGSFQSMPKEGSSYRIPCSEALL